MDRPYATEIEIRRHSNDHRYTVVVIDWASGKPRETLRADLDRLVQTTLDQSTTGCSPHPISVSTTVVVKGRSEG